MVLILKGLCCYLFCLVYSEHWSFQTTLRTASKLCGAHTVQPRLRAVRGYGKVVSATLGAKQASRSDQSRL
ncbi:hypothetical protein PF010_g5094 [Phytophthora fragariae]|uniref:Secreted protein n=1 Tax=Phytophthora fragariae TaxID=53985 RepID=A0A6G0LPC7_9STRA|nr:hypothetical protein PF010_g5094 [Phytophthora fragariae]